MKYFVGRGFEVRPSGKERRTLNLLEGFLIVDRSLPNYKGNSIEGIFA